LKCSRRLGGAGHSILLFPQWPAPALELEEGERDHSSAELVQALPLLSEVVETHFLLELLAPLFADPARLVGSGELLDGMSVERFEEKV
jgi:hypothetical protein